jgi:hypothetical protein
MAWFVRGLCLLVLMAWPTPGRTAPPPVVEVEGQPLAAQVGRLLKALDLLGRPLVADRRTQLQQALDSEDSQQIQKLLDPDALLVAAINPEARVKVSRGPAPARLQQGGFTPVLIKIINASAATPALRFTSPQAGPAYAGTARFSLHRQQQAELADEGPAPENARRFLALELFTSAPLSAELSGLEVEYVLGLIYSSESGKREATLGIDLGQGNQDLGFRGETAVLFDIAPAIPVKLELRDADGRPTLGRLLIRDRLGHVYPHQARRIAPDLFFQPHIYRADGETIWLPPGDFTVEASRGPEYLRVTTPLKITTGQSETLKIGLRRWIDPAARGYYSGDHHIHGAGCAHYTSPTEGVTPEDMFRQVKGEGLNVGCVLTWGPCFRFQRQYFAPRPHGLSDPQTVLKYDLEISGFGSQALGHVCLLNLRDQEYPGSEGTESKGWPTWTTPVMRWCKEQGGFAGYAHSASGLQINPQAQSQRWLKRLDTSGDGVLAPAEAADGLLPESFAKADRDRDGFLTADELTQSHDRAADLLPNLAIPEMNGVGAMEICVSTAEGVCDFISAMDTARIQEWNTWYHLLNCGFPLKVSGETDFPCMSSRQVGTGRVYVQLGRVDPLDFESWCRGLAEGRSYVSDGYAHPLEFRVNGVSPGPDAVALDKAGSVTVTAEVAFAPETPLAVAQGLVTPAAGRRVVGDTVELHGDRRHEYVKGGERLVELIVNGEVVSQQSVPADGEPHQLKWTIPVSNSSWVALRQFPQFHTNPVTVTVGGRPVRASRNSARWCLEVIDQLWRNREQAIAAGERTAAAAAFERARQRYRQILSECDR